MNTIASKLDTAVGMLPQIEKLGGLLQGLKDEDLRGLFAASEDPRFQKRASLINSSHCGGVEYVCALVRATAAELKRLSDLTDVEQTFPEVVPSEVPPVQTEPVALTGPDVHVQVEGPEGVEVAVEDNQIYVVLPENSVLKVSEASKAEASRILAKLR